MPACVQVSLSVEGGLPPSAHAAGFEVLLNLTDQGDLQVYASGGARE